MHRKSIDELKRAGTYRPDRHAKREAAADLLKELPPPPFPLTDTAAEVYAEEGRRLIEQKMLKPSDLRILAMYASEIGVYISEMQTARKEGITVILPNGIMAASAHRRAAEQALKLASGLADKLGLNPNARHRLKGQTAFEDEQPKGGSLFEQLMRGVNADS